MRCGSLGQFASFFIKTTNMEKTQFITASRRRTPWTDKARLSALQSFIDQAAEDAYKKKHPRIPETK